MASNPGKLTPFKPVDRVEVFMWGRQLGAVMLDPVYGFYVFAFDPAWGTTGVEPAPLQMPFSDEAYLFTDLPESTYKRLPALLSDALPDDFGNALIDRYMADRGIGRDRVSSLDRLAYMGKRSMGALEFKPARGPATRNASAIEMSSLVTQARKAVSGTLDDEDHANLVLRNIIEVGTSAGGARAKAVIAWNPATDEIRSGQVDAPEGFEQWLLKFDGMGSDNELGSSGGFGRIEYAYHLMARAAGIDMTDCRLLEENGRAHFMTRRFDREGSNTRHHLQTLCAMGHLDYKKKGTNSYAQMFQIIDRLGLPYEQKKEAFRRMVFNIMGRNCDDHTKNISFRLRQGYAWELSPAYDISFAHNPQGEWTHQHLMSVNGKFKDLSRADCLAEADRFKVGKPLDIIDQVRAAIVQWPLFAQRAGVSAQQIEQISKLHLLDL